MSASGVHVISDAGIHLPHELHLPRTGLSHEANSALGAVTAAVVASAAVSPVMTILDLSIIKGACVCLDVCMRESVLCRMVWGFPGFLLAPLLVPPPNPQHQLQPTPTAQLQKMSIVSAIKTTAGDIFRGRASWRPARPIMSTYVRRWMHGGWALIHGDGSGSGPPTVRWAGRPSFLPKTPTTHHHTHTPNPTACT